ncbi:RICIN domain-containing protein [Streptomyces sp. enrichment culture]|uniref:RICIN domain-containing protein n=1 Tax=Streptomyces sp. enrichment culture TaxID=1795815 RepID=UPI003F56C261
MSLWTSLEPASATVDPGSSTRVRLRVRNTGDVVDEYRFEPVGDLAPWTVIEPATMRLYPGTTGTVELTFSPPRTPDATAGPNPYGVRITPTEHPDAVTVPEGNVTITPFTEVRAELVPTTVKGRFRGKPRLAVDNLGNTKVTASIAGSDQGDHLSYDLHPANVQIEPGRAAFVKGTLRPKQTIWFGSKEERPYALTLQRSGVEPLDVPGTFVQRGFLPRWLATFLSVFMALAIAFVLIWIAYKPQVRTAATELTDEAGVALAPSPSATQELAAPSVAAESPEAQADQPEAGESQDTGAGGGGGGGGGASPSATKEAEASVVPAQNIMLRNTTSDMCAELPGRDKGTTDGPVQQAVCAAGDQDNQMWNLEVVYPEGGPDGTKLFQIRNTKDQYCMDLPDHVAAASGTPVTEFTCDSIDSTDNQLWWADKQESGDYWIRNVASDNLCLAVEGTGTELFAKLTISECTNIGDEEWKIIKPTAE